MPQSKDSENTFALRIMLSSMWPKELKKSRECQKKEDANRVAAVANRESKNEKYAS